MSGKGHEWERRWVFLGAPPSKEHPKGLPPVEAWITCKVCGAQVCQQGKGSVFYRASAYHEWASAEPRCRD